MGCNMNFNGIWNGISNLLKQLLNALVMLLPTSPFIKITDYIDSVPFVSYINWFIPFNILVAITEIWLVSVGLFYLYMVVLRWVKAIE